jgi:outer membrane scaffolding protein for murein synthesis (MipA/OmpV family)
MRYLHGLILTVLCLAQAPARAEVTTEIIDGVTDSVGNITDVLFPNVTNIRLGIGPATSPDYEGSDEYGVKALPLVSFRYKDLIEVDNNNLRVNLFGLGSRDKNKRFRAGPQVKVDFGRDENDSPDLAGLGDIGTSVELGAYGSYRLGPTRTRFRLLHDVAGGHSGTKIIGDVRLVLLKTEQMAVTGSISSTWADGGYMETFFSVNPSQSLASGLPAYNAGAGIKDIRVGITADYELSKRWAVLAHASYTRLLGDAADSPIVSQRGSASQAAAGVFAILSF